MLCLKFFLSVQRFNADYELTARQGADTMAYIALLEEKLRPALVTPSLLCSWQKTNLWLFVIFTVVFRFLQLHTFWVDAENYSNLTRPWFASHSPFPLNFFVPSRYANIALSRILLTKGEAPLHRVSEVEGKVNAVHWWILCQIFLRVFYFHCWHPTLSQIYSDAKECLNLLSYRLGTENYFFGNSWVP